MSSEYLAYDAAAVTLHDTNVQPKFIAIYVGVAGNVKVKTRAGTTVTFVGVQAGTILPIADVELIYITDTTASSLVGLKA